MNRTLIQASALVAGLALTSVASASSVSMDFFSGTWSNATGTPTAFGTTGNGGNNPQARWGGATTSGQSGYNLDMAPPPPTPIIQPILPPAVTPAFFIGNFTHVNQPITPNSITGIDLRITLDITVDTTNVGFRNFDFRFAHDETTNNLNPCPYGGANNQGVNINGCADRVLVSFLDTSESFQINGVDYVFDLLGFSTDGGATIQNIYLTTEQANNTAGLYARIRAREFQQVPEPGSLALLGLGLMGLGLMRRRRMH